MVLFIWKSSEPIALCHFLRRLTMNGSRFSPLVFKDKQLTTLLFKVKAVFGIMETDKFSVIEVEIAFYLNGMLLPVRNSDPCSLIQSDCEQS